MKSEVKQTPKSSAKQMLRGMDVRCSVKKKAPRINKCCTKIEAAGSTCCVNLLSHRPAARTRRYAFALQQTLRLLGHKLKLAPYLLLKKQILKAEAKASALTKHLFLQHRILQSKIRAAKNSCGRCAAPQLARTY